MINVSSRIQRCNILNRVPRTNINIKIGRPSFNCGTLDHCILVPVAIIRGKKTPVHEWSNQVMLRLHNQWQKKREFHIILRYTKNRQVH